MFNKFLAFLFIFIFLSCVFAKQSKSKSGEEIVDVNFCDLLENPSEYKDKTVRVTAIYSYGFEFTKLYCPTCKRQKEIWVECSNDTENCIPKKFKNSFREKKYGVGKTVKVTLVGKFNTYGSYGHMGSYPNQFLIQTVENAKTISNSGINYQDLPKKGKAKANCLTESKQK